MEPITIDFETMPIVGNPLVTPPAPIGVAVWVPGEDPYYEHFDHEREIGEAPNISPDWQMDGQLRSIASYWSGTRDLLFHNAPFDLSVARDWLRLDFPVWSRIHDTMYLAFHDNPYGEVGLKPTAERVLGVPPDEQDELHEWILENVPEATKKTAGAYIYCAPHELVEKYAIGDVVRTKRIFDALP